MCAWLQCFIKQNKYKDCRSAQGRKLYVGKRALVDLNHTENRRKFLQDKKRTVNKENLQGHIGTGQKKPLPAVVAAAAVVAVAAAVVGVADCRTDRPTAKGVGPLAATS